MTGHVYLSVFGFAVLARGYFKVLVIGYDINKLHSKIQYNKFPQKNIYKCKKKKECCLMIKNQSFCNTPLF